jgi:hypothetical protein
MSTTPLLPCRSVQQMLTDFWNLGFSDAAIARFWCFGGAGVVTIADHVNATFRQARVRRALNSRRSSVAADRASYPALHERHYASLLQSP